MRSARAYDNDHYVDHDYIHYVDHDYNNDHDYRTVRYVQLRVSQPREIGDGVGADVQRLYRRLRVRPAGGRVYRGRHYEYGLRPARLTTERRHMKYTIGMPVYSEYDRPVMTCASLLTHHGDKIDEIILVDNKPTSQESRPLAAWCQQNAKLRYVALPNPVGTAPPKNAVFESARPGSHVICMDSHVLLFAGALDALDEFYAANPEAVDDLVQGPLVYNDMTSISSSLSNAWGGDGVWGQWKYDQEMATHKWFEILAQGMGLFACSKAGWLGFNKNYRGFGGEERYIHEKFRKAGRKTWCVAGLRWWHCFGKATPVRYPLNSRDKCRNYAIGLTELGIPLTDLKGRFVSSGEVSADEWDKIVGEAETLTGETVKGCGCKPQRVSMNPGGAPPAPAPAPVVRKGKQVTAAELFDVAARYPSDINEHLPLLRELAAECKTVTEFASGHATIGLIAGIVDGKGKLTSYHHTYRKEAPELYRLAGGAEHFEFVTGDSSKADIAPTEMLFIDTESTAPRLLTELNKHYEKVSKYVVVHRTDTYGEHGSDGGPGLRPAIRQFLKTHKAWFVYRSLTSNNGLMVLSCDPNKKPKLPGKWKQITNFAKAVVDDVATGMKRLPLEVVTERLDTCALCPHHRDGRCALCGCYLEKRPDGGAGKAFWNSQDCPEGRWPSVQ